MKNITKKNIKLMLCQKRFSCCVSFKFSFCKMIPCFFSIWPRLCILCVCFLFVILHASLSLMLVELIGIELFKNNCVMASSNPPLNFKYKVMFSFKAFVSLLKSSHAYFIDPIVDLEQNPKWLPLGLSNRIGVKSLVSSWICNIMQT